MAELVIMEKTELGKCLLHLVDGASAVEELERGMGRFQALLLVLGQF